MVARYLRWRGICGREQSPTMQIADSTAWLELFLYIREEGVGAPIHLDCNAYIEVSHAL